MEALNFQKLVFIETYLAALLLLARLDFSYIAIRFAIAMPFGLGMAVLQPFLRQPFIPEFTELFMLPFGLSATREGALFGSIIFAKFLVSITAVILLSSTTSLSELVASARRLGMPKEMALLFTMMARYLFVFSNMLGRIRRAQKTRCFDLLNKKVPRIWTLQQIGYTISSMFIRSYEQGERTYQSMLCRGYNADRHVYVGSKNLRILDVSFLVLTAGVIIAAQMGLNLSFYT
jgi:cobalt/nickel transport system permease protein